MNGDYEATEFSRADMEAAIRHFVFIGIFIGFLVGAAVTWFVFKVVT